MKYDPEKEQRERIKTLANEIKQTETDGNRRTALLKLKKKLAKGEETFANPTYAEQYQKERMSDIFPLLNHALAHNVPVCFVTINICQGRGKEKKTCWLSLNEVDSFDINRAVDTIRHQLERLSECCYAYITLEIKWDERFERFLPHVHILSFGASKTEMEKHFGRLYPVNEKKRVCRNFYDKKLTQNKKLDPLCLQYPNPIKQVDIHSVSSKDDFGKVFTYMTKMKTYCSRYYFRHLKAVRYNGKTMRPPVKEHNTHLLFLDSLKPTAVLTAFNEHLFPLTEEATNTDEIPRFPSKQEALKFLGYETFRSGQKNVVANILRHERSFFRLKTDFGKSLCFQTAALCRKGGCVVVEPLISVMDDQVKKLNAIKPNFAITINSETSNKKAEYEKIKQGKYKFLYVTPETFCQETFQDVLRQTEICQIVVDEAHCIAFYGEIDFRPKYLKIGELIRKMKTSVKVIALTGSADAKTIKVIRKSLKIPVKACFIENIDRPEITYSVEKRKGKGRKQLRRMIKSCAGTVIIFCTMRDTAMAVSEMLRGEGIATELFLGKGKNNADIIAKSKKERLVIVATSALCMGVDIPHVELVIHFEPPLSLTEYCQGSGRGAREEETSARAVMMYTNDNLGYIRHTFCKTKVAEAQFDAVCKYIATPHNHRKFLLRALGGK